VHIQFDSGPRATQARGRCSGRAETCASCGLKLDGDPEVDPTDAAGPICGECNRARNFDLDEELAWADEE